MTAAAWAVLAVVAVTLRLAGFERGDFDLGAEAGDPRFVSFHPDEATLLRAALQLHDPRDPPLTAYGLLPVYALQAVQAGQRWWRGAPVGLGSPEGPRAAVLGARALAVALSLATLTGLAAAAWRSSGPGAAWLAVALASVPPLVVQAAHFYTVDVVFSLLFLLVLWTTSAACVHPSRPRYLLVGLLVGLAGSVRLNGLALGALLVVAHLVSPRWQEEPDRPAWRRLLVADLWLAGVAAAVTVLVLQPYLVTDPGRMTRSVSTDDFAYSLAVARGQLLRPWSLADVDSVPYLHFWRHLAPDSAGWPLTLLFTAALPWALWRGGRVRRLWVVGCALYFLPVGAMHTKHVRYLLPLVAPLAWLAADGLAAAARRSLAWRRLAVAVAAATLGWTAWFGAAFAGIYRQPDARFAAARWIRDHVPAGAVVAVENGAFTLNGLIDRGRHQQIELGTSALFFTRGYATCQSDARYLAYRLDATDWVGLVDVNRYRQYVAAPSLFPTAASFYTELLAGRLGFRPEARFKVTPALAGRRFEDAAAEPSFLGYDHPGVHILARTGDFAEAISAWEERLWLTDPRCPDRHVRPVTAAMKAQDWPAAAARAAAVPATAAPGLMALLRAQIYGSLGDSTAQRRALDRFGQGFKDDSLSAHLLPWATASSLVLLGQPDLAVAVLRLGVRHREAMAPRNWRAMAVSYVFTGDLLLNDGYQSQAEAAYVLATRIQPEPEAFNAAARLAAGRGDTAAAAALWARSLSLAPNQPEIRRQLGRAAPEP